jgi:hypothetical protein
MSDTGSTIVAEQQPQLAKAPFHLDPTCASRLPMITTSNHREMNEDTQDLSSNTSALLTVVLRYITLELTPPLD